MPTPASLEAILASLPLDVRFELIDGWQARENDSWSFRFAVALSVPASQHMPARSVWHLVVERRRDAVDVRIFPDAVDGITATFQHQDHNAPAAEGAPWRAGKPCLERPAAAFRRNGWSGEPEGLADRVTWHIGRLMDWIDAAASGCLAVDGDPVELPPLPLAATDGIVVFREEETDFTRWNAIGARWGFARLERVPGSARAAAISEFLDRGSRVLRRIEWTGAVQRGTGRPGAVWVRLPRLPVMEPWQLPTTWRELADLCALEGIDLPGLIADAGAAIRRMGRPKRPHPNLLLLGFPLAENHGTPARRHHWLALAGMRTCRRSDVREGFSDRSGSRRRWDREACLEERPLEWVQTSNWAPDQLRRRGGAEEEVRSASILLIGCGALGSPIADNLVRMGVKRLAIMDPDKLAGGNLVRHLLGMADVDENKAASLAARLNATMPDADVTALPFHFPPNDEAGRKALEGWDVVVDCTADDEVLHAMARYPWDGEKVFVSLSLTWRAEGLFTYAATEASFPAVDALEAFHGIGGRPDGDLPPVEGIGCWHPVFPAAADDVQLWAAIGTKCIRRSIVSRARVRECFERGDDGSVIRRGI